MSKYEKYIKELEELKKQSELAILANLPYIEQQIYNTINDLIAEYLEIKNGSLIETKESIDRLNEFTSKLLKELAEVEPFKKGVSSLLKNLRSTTNVIADFHDIKPAKLFETSQIVENAIIDDFLGNGLNANFVQPVRDLLHQNMSNGTRVQDARKYLKDYVLSGKDQSGKLSKYITNIANNSVSAHTGFINKKLMQSFKFKNLIMSGSLIETSSPQCRIGLGEFKGILDRYIFEKKLLPVAEKNGLIAGTTFETLPANGLHHGCRHEFTPANFEDGDIIGTTEKI